MGYMLLAVPLVGYFVAIVVVSGWLVLAQVVAAFGAVGVMAVICIGGIRLIAEAKKDDEDRRKAEGLAAVAAANKLRYEQDTRRQVEAGDGY